MLGSLSVLSKKENYIFMYKNEEFDSSQPGRKFISKNGAIIKVRQMSQGSFS